MASDPEAVTPAAAAAAAAAAMRVVGPVEGEPLVDDGTWLQSGGRGVPGGGMMDRPMSDAAKAIHARYEEEERRAARDSGAPQRLRRGAKREERRAKKRADRRVREERRRERKQELGPSGKRRGWSARSGRTRTRCWTRRWRRRWTRGTWTA